nr:hypothetical protein [uncultured Carboxylicivirga sp.]
MKKAFLLVIASFLFFVSNAQLKKEDKYKVIYNQGFNNDKSTVDFEYSNADKWLISKQGKPGKSLKCLGKGEYTTENGSPEILAILKDYEVSDFILEMTIQQNGKNFGLLDFCVFYGVKDKEHYQYAQIAGHADKKTYKIFEVNGDKPHTIGQNKNDGVLWGINQWHQLKVVRNTQDKSLKVYFNNELILETDNDVVNSGLIGFGSTNSAIKVDNIKLMAPNYTENNIQIF